RSAQCRSRRRARSWQGLGRHDAEAARGKSRRGDDRAGFFGDDRPPRRCRLTTANERNTLLFEHDLIRKPASTLGPSPRAGFFGIMLYSGGVPLAAKTSPAR